MKRLMIAVLLLTAVPALADHDHGGRDSQARDLPGNAIAVDRQAVKQQPDDLSRAIDRMASENRANKRDRLAAKAKDELNELRDLVDVDDGHGRRHERDRDFPEHAVAVDERAVRSQLDDLSQLIDRVASEDRGNKRSRIADHARDEVAQLVQMVKEAPSLDRSRWADYQSHRGSNYPAETVPANYHPGSQTNVPPPPPPGQGTYHQQPTVYPMSQPSLNQLTSAIRRESFPKERLRVLDSAASSNYFVVAQAQTILESFDFPSDRLAAMRILKPRLLDRENFFKLYDSFTFPNDKAQLKQILDQQ